MNHSQYQYKLVKSTVLDHSNAIENKPLKNIVMVQGWLNNINKEIKFEENFLENMINSWKLTNLQENVKNKILPKIESLNSWTLELILAYEAMLVDIVDNTPSNLILTVEILLHLKIITNIQIHKFRIFE